MLANAFDHGESTTVANSKTFTGAAGHKQLSRSCSVQNGVSGKHVAAPRSSRSSGNRYGSSRQTLSDVIVGFAFQFEVYSKAKERAETLSRAAVKFFFDEFSRRASCSATSRHFPAQACANAAVGIADHGNSRIGLELLLNRRSLGQRCVNSGHLLRGNAERHIGFECERGSFRVIRIAWPQTVVRAFEFAERIRAEGSQLFANFIGKRAEVGNHHFRFAGKTGAQSFILRGDSNRASIQMALTSHHAADGKERSGTKAKFIGTENRSD